MRKEARRVNVDSFTNKSYDVSLLNISEEDFEKFERVKNDLYFSTIGTCFTQIGANKGIKLLGEKAVAAIFKEYKQLDDLKVLGVLDPESLTVEQKRKALRAINLIKLKRCGKVKGRTCADGSGQRKYIPREDAASPTLSLESLMAILLIAIFDVPGAYLHADIP